MTQSASPFDQSTVAPAPPPGAPVAPPAPLVGVKATDEIPATDLTEAYRAGRILFRADERVPVRLASGEMGTVAAHEAPGVIDGGGELVPQAEYHAHVLKREYGGLAGGIGAAAAGAARGLSIGASDPLAIGAARAFGGDASADAMRERLGAYKDLHPVTSAVSEVAGMVAPALLSDGASVGVEGAGLLGKGARLAGAPLEGIGALGRLGERAAGRLLPAAGEDAGLLARAATKAATKGVGGAVEGAAFGAGSEVSEDSLGDHELTAEKLLSSMGHGAVLGGLVSGAAGAVGEVGGDLLAKVRADASPYLHKQAGEQAWKSLDPNVKFTREAQARVKGGTAEAGRVLLEAPLADGSTVIPKEAGLAGAALTPEELLPRIQDAKDVAGKKIGAILEGSGAQASVAELDAQIEDVIAPLRKKAGFGKIANAVEDYRADLLEKLGVTSTKVEGAAAREEMVIPAKLEGERAQLEKLAKVVRSGSEDAATARAVLDSKGVTWKQIAATEPRLESNLAELKVPITALFEQKRALGDLVYKEANALDPTLRVEYLRDIYGRISDLEMQTIDRAAKDVGDKATGAELAKARKDYQALSLAQKAAEKSTAKYATNRNLGMSEYLAAGMAAASGHILAAPIVAAGHKYVRARGNAFLAATFDRLSALQTLARKSDAVDKEIGQGVKAFVGRLGGKDIATPAREATGETAREEFERRTADLEAGKSADHSAPVMALGAHAPKVAAAFTQRAAMATTWLASQIPQPPKIGSRTPSDQEIYAFNVKARAVDAPVATLVDGMAKGNLSLTQVNAVKATAPSLYADIQAKLQTEVEKTIASGKVNAMPYDVRRDLALLFNIDATWSMTADGVKTLQANTQPLPSGAGGKPDASQQPGPAPKRPVPSGASGLMSAGEQQSGQIRSNDRGRG